MGRSIRSVEGRESGKARHGLLGCGLKRGDVCVCVCVCECVLKYARKPRNKLRKTTIIAICTTRGPTHHSPVVPKMHRCTCSPCLEPP